MKAGPHSPWVSRLLTELGHEVIMADARKLRLIYRNPRKNDRIDAEYLARLARLGPQLSSPGAPPSRGGPAGARAPLPARQERTPLPEPRPADERAASSRRSGRFDLPSLHPELGRSSPLPEAPRGGTFPGDGSPPEPIRWRRSAAAYYQDGRRLPAAPTGGPRPPEPSPPRA